MKKPTTTDTIRVLKRLRRRLSAKGGVWRRQAYKKGIDPWNRQYLLGSAHGRLAAADILGEEIRKLKGAK